MIEQRLVTSDGLGSDERGVMRAMFAAAWDGGFTEEDWEHTFGGVHVLRFVDGVMVSHGAVAERTLWLGDRPLSVGYLEAVALPLLSLRLRGRAGSRYAGLRILARD